MSRDNPGLPKNLEVRSSIRQMTPQRLLIRIDAPRQDVI